jgi:dTDP-4-amino-4,6-dideoxygalactose transaminase
MDIANRHNLFVVEDAAQAIDSFYIGKDGAKKALGTIGHLAAFSFHETKNIQCGEGGLLAINDKRFVNRSEIIWEKGTNRAEFFRGEVNKYGWVDIGSSFLPSEITAAFLYAQLENLDVIQKKRTEIWNRYYQILNPLETKGQFKLPTIPDFATNNAHMFYMVFPTMEERGKMISKLKDNAITAVFHYLSLHVSPYYTEKYEGKSLPNSDRYSDCLLRLPMFFELTDKDQDYIFDIINSLYN